MIDIKQVITQLYPIEGKQHESNKDLMNTLSVRCILRKDENLQSTGKLKLLPIDYQDILRQSMAYYIEKTNDGNKVLWFYDYDTHRYTLSTDLFEKALMVILEKSPTSYEIKTEYNALLKSEENSLQPKHLTSDMLAAKNTIVNVKTKECIDYSMDIFVKSTINTNYNPDLKIIPKINDQSPEDLIKTLANHNEERFKGLLQVIKQAVLKRNLEQSIIFLVGEGGHGKSTYINIIRHLIGDESISATTIDELEDDNQVLSLIEKHILLGDDINDGIYMDKLRHLKSLSGGGLISVKRKYLNVISFKFEGLFIQAMPRIVKMNDRADQMSRRIKPYLFEHDFKKDSNKISENDLNTFLQLEEVKEFILNLALNIEDCDKWLGWDEDLLSESTLQNNPIASFIDYIKTQTNILEMDNIPLLALKNLYLDYHEVALQSNKAIKTQTFVNDIKTVMLQLGYKYSNQSKIRQKSIVKYLLPDIETKDKGVKDSIDIITTATDNRELATEIISLSEVKSQIGPWTDQCLNDNKTSFYFSKIK